MPAYASFNQLIPQFPHKTAKTQKRIMKLLVLKDGEQYGPYEQTELEGYVQQGSFSLSDLCWQESWEDWKPLSSIISRPPPNPSPGSPPPMNPVQQPTRQEETVFSDGAINITTTRIIIRGTTYALRNITSVKMAMTPAKQGCAILFLIFSIFFALASFILMTQDPGSGIFGLLIFGGMATGAFFWVKACKPSYHVSIASASGEAHALTSPDRAYIESVVSNINEAIVRYQ
jgi:hypothetical protein